MKRSVVLAAALLVLSVLGNSTYSTSLSVASTESAQVPAPSFLQPDISIERMKLRPITFTENMGQWDDRVRFRADAGGATMWFTDDGVCYQFTRQTRQETGLHPYQDRFVSIRGGIQQLVMKASFVGANPSPEIVGDQVLEYKCNYFIGDNPDEWHTDVPNFRAVVFKDIYAGIDLKYYGNGRQMEYDFIVSAGADPSQIAVHYEGAKSTMVNDRGELVVETDWGTVTEMRPHVYQLDALGPILIQGDYVLYPGNRFGFELDDTYDPALAVVIDPEITYSTYLGGSGTELVEAIAADGDGNAYVTGLTASHDFPIHNAYQSVLKGADVFVTKLASDGSGVVYSTFLGGTDMEWSYGITVDESGCAYVAGKTSSSDFPCVSPYQEDQALTDAFVTKINAGGNGLVYSTYLGGSADDCGEDVAVDASGFAYVTGYTSSTDFPTSSPYQTNQGDIDAFVCKVNGDGSSLVYSTYIGGSEGDWGYSIVEQSGLAYISGVTNSTDFPVLNAYQTDQVNSDVFVTKLNSAGDNLVYSTYLGGDGVDVSFGVAVDNNGCAYVTGETMSPNFPTVGAYQADQGDDDAFVAKLNSSGNGLLYSTYLGGASDDYAHGVAVDIAGNAYVVGSTTSSDFPTESGFQAYGGNRDAFLVKFNGSGNDMLFGTYLGGSGIEGLNEDDGSSSMWMDDLGNIYVTGWTMSSDFPTHNPYQTHQGEFDAFVVKLSDQGTYVCGDANSSGDVDIDDIMYIIDFIFTGGPEPGPYDSGDVNCSGFIDIDDVMYLINYVFTGGPDPCDTDDDGGPDC